MLESGRGVFYVALDPSRKEFDAENSMRDEYWRYLLGILFPMKFLIFFTKFYHSLLFEISFSGWYPMHQLFANNLKASRQPEQSIKPTWGLSKQEALHSCRSCTLIKLASF